MSDQPKEQEPPPEPPEAPPSGPRAPAEADRADSAAEAEGPGVAEELPPPVGPSAPAPEHSDMERETVGRVTEGVVLERGPDAPVSAGDPVERFASDGDATGHGEAWRRGDDPDRPDTDRARPEDLGRQVREDFDPDGWETATREDKQAMLEGVHEQVNSSLGLDEAPPIAYDDSMPARRSGEFDPGTRQITLNDRLLDQPDAEEALRTVAHESRHDYQSHVINGQIEDPNRQAWIEASEVYDPNDVISYMENPLEIDAFRAEDEFIKGFDGERQ